jgi:hypothetical protein
VDLSFYANLAEIIGTIAIVVSLIYVGIQIRQSNRHLEEEAQRARAQSFRENMTLFANNAETMAKDQGGETLTASEVMRMNSIWMSALFSYQTSFQQLPRKEINTHTKFFRYYFETMRSPHTTWQQHRETFRSDLVKFIEENVIQ